MVAKATENLELEMMEKEEEKVKYLEEKTPPLQTSSMSITELRVDCHVCPKMQTIILAQPT